MYYHLSASQLKCLISIWVKYCTHLKSYSRTSLEIVIGTLGPWTGTREGGVFKALYMQPCYHATWAKIIRPPASRLHCSSPFPKWQHNGGPAHIDHHCVLKWNLKHNVQWHKWPCWSYIYKALENSSCPCSMARNLGQAARVEVKWLVKLKTHSNLSSYNVTYNKCLQNLTFSKVEGGGLGDLDLSHRWGLELCMGRKAHTGLKSWMTLVGGGDLSGWQELKWLIGT